jgi:hypothetical protein
MAGLDPAIPIRERNALTSGTRGSSPRVTKKVDAL